MEAIALGMNDLKKDLDQLDEIFSQYKAPELNSKYGQKYIDSIKQYLSTTKIPVLQSWSFDMTKVPSISIHLGAENEDETKAAMSDFVGIDDDGKEILSGVANITLDIGIHSDKNKDSVIWLYYMVCHILYQRKMLFHNLGLKNVTFSANDYNKESKYLTDVVWTRWLRFRCTVQNYVPSLAEVKTISDVDVTDGLDLDINGDLLPDYSGSGEIPEYLDVESGIGFQKLGDLDNSSTVYYK